jgi:UDP-glucose 4-epimerase
MRILDLARYFGERSGKDIRTVGIRPGEKIHEILLNEEESTYAIKNGTKFVINRKNDRNTDSPAEFSSRDHCVSYEYLKSYMDKFMGTIS